MKHNESLLVYGVTGLLVVILVVAVVFGGEGGPAVDKEAPPPANAAPVSDLEDLLDPLRVLDIDASASAAMTPADASLAASVPAAPITAEVPPVAPSNDTARVGDYRQVSVRKDDTLSGLVQRWCGTVDSLSIVRALNEDLDVNRLPVGRTILVPWVDDAILAAKGDGAGAAGTATASIGTPPPPTDGSSPNALATAVTDPAPGHTYKVKSGDSLWKLAVLATGNPKDAPAYIHKVIEMNPGLVPERMPVGHDIVLP